MARAKISSSKLVRGGASVQVFGLEEILAKLEAINSVVRIELGYMMNQAAAFLTETAISYAPERTGNLKTSIHPAKVGPYTWMVLADTRAGSDPGGEGKNKYEYAGYVEHGTSRTPAQPFMAPAAEATIGMVDSSIVALAARIEAL